MAEQLIGTIQTIIFRNNQNGWSVIELSTEDTGEEHTVVGVLPTCAPGERVELTGAYIQHPSYGHQFKAESCVCLAPATLSALESYLGSGLIKGVGPATAKRIVGHFGMDALTVLENQPERLMKIPGIGKSKAATIAASFYEQRAMRDVMMGLQELGVTVNQSVKLYQRYGASCLNRIQEDPYQLIEEVDGFGFKTADGIAQRAGLERYDRSRLQAGVKYVLNWARQDGGHTFLPRQKLIEVAANILEVEREPVEEALDECILTGGLMYQMVGDTDAVFLPVLYHLEADAARRLLTLAVRPHTDRTLNLMGEIQLLERERGIALAPQQREAVTTALTEGVMVITGGPGTGKTTILRFIIHVLNRLGMDFALCAPTGRAAKRMEEATGCDASTIHRLLEYGGGEDGYFSKNEDDPLLYDMVVVDEMSMVDVPLMHALLKALPQGTRLVMVGDADQLPPVGAGNVLRDIIESGVMPVIRLTEIFRQSERSGIVLNAHRINVGQEPLPNRDEEFAFEEYYSAGRVLGRVLELCAVEGKTTQLQVLAPMKKGPLGVKNLNVQLQARLNPKEKRKPEREFGETVFRLGDKVMQIKNDYRMEWTRTGRDGMVEMGTGVYNGDLGTIYRMNIDERTLEVLFDDERLAEYEFIKLDELELAYCISIHKSQGSEFPVVILPLVSGPPMLMTRNLLYTAITRARHRVVIAGRWDAVLGMVKNQQTKRRFSALKTRLMELSTLQ